MKSFDTFLKLCLVFMILLTSGFVACGGAAQDYAIAKGWAGVACSMIQALPEASANAFPTDHKLTMTVTSSSVQAVVTTPSVSAVPSIYERRLP
jgi:hypothetical protein